MKFHHAGSNDYILAHSKNNPQGKNSGALIEPFR